MKKGYMPHYYRITFFRKKEQKHTEKDISTSPQDISYEHLGSIEINDYLPKGGPETLMAKAFRHASQRQLSATRVQIYPISGQQRQFKKEEQWQLKGKHKRKKLRTTDQSQQD